MFNVYNINITYKRIYYGIENGRLATVVSRTNAFNGLVYTVCADTFHFLSLIHNWTTEKWIDCCWATVQINVWSASLHCHSFVLLERAHVYYSWLIWYSHTSEILKKKTTFCMRVVIIYYCLSYTVRFRNICWTTYT